MCGLVRALDVKLGWPIFGFGSVTTDFCFRTFFGKRVEIVNARSGFEIACNDFSLEHLFGYILGGDK